MKYIACVLFLLLVSCTKEEPITPDSGDYTPKTSVGSVGNYAVVAVTSTLTTWYKNRSGAWVVVGSPEWAQSWPIVTGTVSATSVSGTIIFTVGGNVLSTITVASASLAAVAAAINVGTYNNAGVYAAVVNSKLQISSNNVIDSSLGDSTLVNSISISGTALAGLGITADDYLVPKLSIQAHTSVPTYKRTDNLASAFGRPT